MSYLPPILLTSSVTAMDRSVKLKDEKLRIFHTLESIERWLGLFPQAQLVLCDGSNFDFSELVNEKFPRASIECLFFMNDPRLILLHGKGFGEGEIIRYALDHSRILGRSSWFAKCTAKLWVDNFFECTKSWNGKFLCQAYFSGVFSLKETHLQYIDTRFYLASKIFYTENLLDAHINVGGEQGIGIEKKFLDVVLAKNIKAIFFRTPPVVCGVGGGSGKYYNASIIRRLKERLRMALVVSRPKYRALFSKNKH